MSSLCSATVLRYNVVNPYEGFGKYLSVDLLTKHVSVQNILYMASCCVGVEYTFSNNSSTW